MGAMIILGGILGRCFCRNAARQTKSHLPPRGTTVISSALEALGVATAMHPSSSLKCSHVRRRESLSAFWSSRTALRLFFSPSRKIQKATSLELFWGSCMGIPPQCPPFSCAPITATLQDTALPRRGTLGGERKRENVTGYHPSHRVSFINQQLPGSAVASSSPPSASSFLSPWVPPCASRPSKHSHQGRQPCRSDLPRTYPLSVLDGYRPAWSLSRPLCRRSRRRCRGWQGRRLHSWRSSYPSQDFLGPASVLCHAE